MDNLTKWDIPFLQQKNQAPEDPDQLWAGLEKEIYTAGYFVPADSYEREHDRDVPPGEYIPDDTLAIRNFDPPWTKEEIEIDYQHSPWSEAETNAWDCTFLPS